MISAYMPSAFSDSVSMTSCLSSLLHLPMFLSEWTADLMYSIMSCFCPLSSCREILRDVNGSSTVRISISGLLATHRCRFGRFQSTSSSISSRISPRADVFPGKFGQSSRASRMIKIGACPGRLSMSVIHFLSASIPGFRMPRACSEYN